MVAAGLRLAASPAAYAMYPRNVFRQLFVRARARPQLDPSILSVLDDLWDWDDRAATGP
jgi:hypothetical protein